MNAQDWLDRADALAAGATEGPWAYELTTPAMHGTNWHLRVSGKPGIRAVVSEYRHGPGNAEFIAASRTLVPDMSAALRAVLDLHRTTVAGTCQVCWASTWIEQGLSLYNRPTPILAPCPTVRSITDALDGAS